MSKQDIYIETPFTVKVIDNKGVEELQKDRLYTVIDIKPDLIHDDKYGFKLLEVQPDEPFDSYLSSRFTVKIGLYPN